VGAEYVLRWLPRGTHQWERFIMPAELRAYAEAAGLEMRSIQGLVYRLWRDEWVLAADTDVNYLVAMARPAGKG
jgi:2-polyprenyl-6-hydroxyphenyl methylase / 3-demethylubiquinone-9 3-methyltransferase